jgi:hypothetical protein
VKHIILVLTLFVFGAPAAQAITCRDWGRTYEDQKVAVVYGLIDDAVAGSGGRSMGVNRAAVARCLEHHAEKISYAFDDACANRGTAGMQALNNIFKNYIWTCVN